MIWQGPDGQRLLLGAQFASCKSTADLDELHEFMSITCRPFRSIIKISVDIYTRPARPSGELANVQNPHVVAVALEKVALPDAASVIRQEQPDSQNGQLISVCYSSVTSGRAEIS